MSAVTAGCVVTGVGGNREHGSACGRGDPEEGTLRAR